MKRTRSLTGKQMVFNAAMRWFRYYGGPSKNWFSETFPADRRLWAVCADAAKRLRGKR